MHGGVAPQHALLRKFWLLQGPQGARSSVGTSSGHYTVDLLTIYRKRSFFKCHSGLLGPDCALSEMQSISQRPAATDRSHHKAKLGIDVGLISQSCKGSIFLPISLKKIMHHLLLKQYDCFFPGVCCFCCFVAVCGFVGLLFLIYILLAKSQENQNLLFKECRKCPYIDKRC